MIDQYKCNINKFIIEREYLEFISGCISFGWFDRNKPRFPSFWLGLDM